MTKRFTIAVIALASAMTLFAGCAEVPTNEIQAAQQAVDQAQLAEAATYAPDALQAVEDAQARLDAELEAQEERFALTRSYETATTLANELREAAEQAETAAVEGRNNAREEAATLMAEVRTTLDEVRTLLAEAPRGKGAELDLAMLQSDVSQIESSLAETESAFTEERYIESMTMAQAALSSASEVRTHIQNAMPRRATRS